MNNVKRGCGPLSPLYDEALTWAASLHRDQHRKNTKVPYIAHLVAVSSIVLEDGGTETEGIEQPAKARLSVPGFPADPQCPTAATVDGP